MEVGEKIKGQSEYLILEKIASGGMGSVLKAKMLGVEGFEKIVAIKTILSKYASNEIFVKRFVFEAKLVASLVHENIVQIYQLDKRRKEYFFVQEYVDGITLYDFMEFHKKVKLTLPIELAVFIASRIARGLAFAHSRYSPQGEPLNIIHCDICSHNLMINREGVPKITDFGIAKAATMQRTGKISGKLAFMSPEQYSDPDSMTAQSDIYSLGVVLFYMLSLEHTRDLNSGKENLVEQIKTNYINWSVLPDTVPDKLREILSKMLSFNPADRFSNSAELAKTLEYYIYKDGYGPTIVSLAEYMKRTMPGFFCQPYDGDFLTVPPHCIASNEKTIII